MASTTPSHRPLLALGIRVVAVLALTTTVMLVKLAGEHGVHLVEIMFWRQALTAPIILLWLIPTRTIETLKTGRMLAHIRRAMIGLVGMVLSYQAILHLPLAEAQTLNFTTPIFATILAVFLLGERIGHWRWFALAMGFAGILVIAQPGHSQMPVAGVLYGLGAALSVALLSILIKDLNRTETPATIVFWFASITTPLLALALPWVVTPHDPTGWALLMTVGVVGAFGQLLLTAALRFGAVASVIVMDYTGLVWATLYGWFIFDSLPPATTWLGAPLIIAAGSIIAWRDHALARAESEAEAMMGR